MAVLEAQNLAAAFFRNSARQVVAAGAEYPSRHA